MRYLVTGIEWDADAAGVGLPTAAFVDLDGCDNAGAEDVLDALSDQFEWCVSGVESVSPFTLEPGDQVSVDVPKADSTSGHSASFYGLLVEVCDGHLVVEDMEGDCYSPDLDEISWAETAALSAPAEAVAAPKRPRP